MSVGNDQIDSDHKKLIAIVNEFEDAVERGLSRDALHKVAQHLWDYTKTHFQREEHLQVMVNYPYQDAHRREHRELLDSVKDTIRRYFVDKTESADDAAARALGEFLRTWLVEHIIKSDLRMKPFLTGRSAPARAS